MPTYVYGCDRCSHRFEAFQKFQDAPLTECPECGARIRRIFQPAGIVFKGSGWYSTDSRSNKAPQATADGAEAANGTAQDGKQNGEQPASTSKGDDTAKAPSESAASSKAAE
ncbi:MAG: hypothetical protein M3380_08365 [Chloroflexota bacterium]|nr:hypothetical protein [Chloroflexota bacterium]